MKLEVGKYYKTRDGRKVGPLEYSYRGCDSEWPYGLPDSIITYSKNGTHLPGGYKSHLDLIAEWTDIPTIGTLAEIGAQVGDVVEWVSDDGVSKISIGHVGRKHTIQSDGRVMLNGGGGCYWGVLGEVDDYMGVKWRIVSRAPDLSKLDYTPINLEKPIYDIEPDTRPLEHFQYGPVITETVKRIVPGVYGDVEISEDFTHQGGVGVYMNSTLDAPRIRAAIATLTEIAGAMSSE